MTIRQMTYGARAVRIAKPHLQATKFGMSVAVKNIGSKTNTGMRDGVQALISRMFDTAIRKLPSVFNGLGRRPFVARLYRFQPMQ